jgi:hypothetical protein
MWRASPDAACSGLPLMPLDIAWAADMVIDVACGPMAYKTQILAHHFSRKPIVVFLRWNKKRVTGMISTKNVQYSM